MGKGRAPCCDKSRVKRGPWSPEEDLKLITFIQKHGHDNWRSLPQQAGLLRCGKSCRLRWINYLRPDVKRGNFTKEEEETIIRLHEALGNRWSKIASHLPGRTDNEIKNVWNTYIKKRFIKSSESSADESKQESSLTSSSSSSPRSFSSNETPNTSKIVGDEFNEQGPQDLMAEKTEQISKKQVSNEFDGITEDAKELSTSFSSIESTISNLGQIVAYEPEELMGSSPFNYLGPYDVNSTLEEVHKPNSLLEIPFESDYDFWNMLDNIGSFQSNEVQGQTSNLGQQSTVQDAESRKLFHELEKELGLGAEEEENQLDQFLRKNEATETGMDPQTSFEFEMMTKPESDLDMADFQPSWPNNSGFCV